MNHAHVSPPRLRVRTTEDPAVAARQRQDDYSSHVVPATARVPRVTLTMSYWSLLSAMVWYWERLATGLFGLRMRRTVWVLLVTVAAFALMLTDVLEHLQTALNWQSAILVPWFGIVCTHFLMSRHDRSAGPEFRAGRLPLVTPGLVVWLVGAALGICLTEIEGVPAAWSGLSALVSLGVSVVLYAAVLVVAPVRAPRAVRDPRDEVDPWRAWITCASCDESHLAQEFGRDPRTGDPLCDECATRRRLSPGAVGVRGAPAPDAALPQASSASSEA